MDIKAESDRLYSGYVHEAIVLSLGGLVAILGLLFVVFRSPMRVCSSSRRSVGRRRRRDHEPGLAGKVTILHLVGMLLVVAVGSNYALFFERPAAAPILPRALASLLLAGLTTVAGFGILAFSGVSLSALGVTVGPGVMSGPCFIRPSLPGADDGLAPTQSRRQWRPTLLIRPSFALHVLDVGWL